jgi:hypothetical protein
MKFTTKDVWIKYLKSKTINQCVKTIKLATSAHGLVGTCLTSAA